MAKYEARFRQPVAGAGKSAGRKPPKPVKTAKPVAAKPVKPVKPQKDPAVVAAKQEAVRLREAEERREGLIRQRQSNRKITAQLQARFPELFTVPVPLAIGIAKQIRETMGPESPPVAKLRAALHSWTQASAYLQALAAGQHRRNLDGTDAGETAEDHALHARDMVARRMPPIVLRSPRPPAPPPSPATAQTTEG